ncbi:MAG TPA: ABC transporter permease [Chloroflexota bacterium]|jgi:peptide/nickel transport system permease protein
MIVAPAEPAPLGHTPVRDTSAVVHPPRSEWALAWRQFRRHRLALAGLIVFTMLCSSAVVAGLSPYDPNRTSLLARFEAPSLVHPMGTDDLGRDEMTRVLIGGRISLLVGITAMAVSIVVGTVIGSLAGYFGGRLDSILMRSTEAFIAFPQLFLLILLAALVGTNLWTIVLVVGLLRWMPVARLVRAAFLQIKEQEYVTAARTLGASTTTVMGRHILPNALSPIIVAATLGVAGAILTESTLSFLGLGIQLPTATWGNMLRAAQNDMTTAPWLAFFPGLFIFLTILSVNYIGDGLRDALDPRKT